MNYYSYMFHAQHEAGNFWEFKGMNYPFYEYVIYTGAHPVHSYLIGVLGLEHYGIGILNLMMLLSFPMASVFLFLVMRHYKVSVLWAVVAAIAITYLTPQLARMTGHFALSYVFAIPAMWWIMLKCRHGNGQLWGVLSFLYVFYFFLTHPYLGMILVLFSFTFWIIVYIYNRSLWKYSAGFIAMQVVLPVMVFRLLVFSTDTHYGRIDEPAGFFSLYGSWKSLYVPHHGPLAGLTRAFEVEMPPWESWSYVGAASILFFLYSLAYLIVRRKELPIKLIFKHELFMFFLAAYLILVFSFCFPFKYNWARWITDYFGTVKQFRVLGRFTWIFYYVFTTATVIVLFHIYKKEGKRLLLTLFFFVGMAFMMVESHEENVAVSDYISATPNTFKEENLSRDMQELVEYVNENDFDAFIFIPFFHLSSENMMILGEEQASFDAYMLSYHTGLPMMNCLASRMSQPESIAFNNFFGSEYMEKELIYDLPEKDKIALISNQDYLSDEELRMVFTQKVEYTNATFTLYQFDRGAWNTSLYFDQMRKERDSANVQLTKDWSSTQGDIWFHYESWDQKSLEGMKGRGALHGIKEGYDLLWEASADQLSVGEYEVSFWFNHAVDRADLAAFAELSYKSNGETEWVDIDDLKESNEIVGHWLRGQLNFSITKDIDSVKVFLAGNWSRKPYIVDELLVRKVDDPAIFSTGTMGGKEYIIYNNYWLRSDSFQKK